MKVIGLMPAKNEAWILKTTLPPLMRFVDDLIVLDGRSTDETANLVKQHGGTIILQEGDQARYSRWRQILLEAARARGATHTVWLDADEAFTSNFLSQFRPRLETMKPGQKLILDWLCLWKDARQVRSDNSVWSVNPKDFVFREDGTSNFTEALLHEGRTPGPNTEDRRIRVPREEGAVLHFQFVPFRRFQMKQAYIQTLEWLTQKAPAWEVNQKYSITRDDPDARCVAMPPEWLAGFSGLEALKDQDVGWHYQGMLDFFKRHGLARFEPMDIWHIPEFHERFRRELGREPRPATPPSAPYRLASRVVRKLRRLCAGTPETGKSNG